MNKRIQPSQDKHLEDMNNLLTADLEEVLYPLQQYLQKKLFKIRNIL